MKEFSVVLFLAAFTGLFVDGAQCNDVIAAIEAGDKEKLSDLLSNWTDINKCLEKVYETPLSIAIRKKKIELALFLMEKGANPNKNCGDSYPPLDAATHLGSVTLVKALLDKGVEVDEDALVTAMVFDHKDILELFIPKDFDPNKQYGNCETTLLFLAVRLGRVNLTELLLEKGADIDHKDCYNYTALNRACWRIEADNLQEFRIIEKCMVMLIDAGANVHTTDIFDNGTALIHASNSASFTVVKRLIEKGADVNAIDNSGNTALSFAMDNLKNKPLAIVKELKLENMVTFLLENGADVHVGSSLREIAKRDYETDDLISAIKAGDKETLLDLLSNGTDINKCLESNICKPLSLAIAKRNEEIIRILIENGAEVNGLCYLRDSCSPLEVATREGLMTVVKTLLDRGAVIDVIALTTTYDYDRKDIRQLFLERGFDTNKTFGYYDRTMLFDAASKGYVNMTKLLLEIGVDIEQRDYYGYTALNWACHEMMVNRTLTKKIEKCVELLIDGGANVNATNKQDNMYSLYYATKSNSSVVVKKLMEKDAIFGNHTEYGPNGKGYN